MTKMIGMTGNEAVAEAMRQINPDVVAAYPITPQTEIVQIYSSFVSNGQVDTEMVTVESEHSAMSATVGASSAGARAMTATSANGLALMWEIVYICASMRLPVVMPVVNRALSGPINIHNDHSDTMGARDSGWIQIFSENAQEAYDNTVMATRISENKNVLLPTMVMMDGFIISHAMEAMTTLPDDVVKKFVGNYKPENPLLDIANPVTIGPLDLFDWYFEHKRQQAQVMIDAKSTILKVSREFGKISGRNYGLFEEYMLDDAEIAIIVIGSTAGTAKKVIKDLRANGIKAGMLKIRVFRPFPATEIVKAIKGAKAIAVMDKSDSYDAVGGPVYKDVRSAMYGKRGGKIVNYIYGLGGRDVTEQNIHSVFEDLKTIADTGKVANQVTYLGVRE
ncbi:MAG TPA: pyruvate ferredoxin oxidoreductase [Bacillota bacterium]|nr:pyruvate ferredoxin oxidoreductase [Bacillota bacterium]HOH10061.1 pyruvate ferredoxin oxidoreductase [Bacillota bacterium]HPI01413.1 pyruvate ferredoxin oxidoreductase [Bacillota bacterium]HPM63232.1 pyruvate ferredoxin oxidoreductase [Bacillota bacterium]